MRTNIVLDGEVVEELVRLSGRKSKTAAVAWAVQEQIRREKIRLLCGMFGKIDIDGAAIEGAVDAEKTELGS